MSILPRLNDRFFRAWPGCARPVRRLQAGLVAAGILLSALILPVRAQTFEDGQLLPRRLFCTGFTYAHDSWDHYWEGRLKRDNENIGTLTTQSLSWMAGYGVSDRLTLMAMLPYIWTEASKGPLHGISGIQDLSVGAKYRLLETPFTARGTMNAFVVGGFGVPIGDYSPDFLPLSIGMASRRLSGRFIASFMANEGWFINGSAAYTWRNNVKLDRPSYFTNGQLYLSDEVMMPDVVDYAVSIGYKKGRMYIPITLSEQRTLGGGDIRRQDMPFVSNKMDFVRIDGWVSYNLPVPNNLEVRAGASRILNGRNVGQSTSFTGSLLYLFQL